MSIAPGWGFCSILQVERPFGVAAFFVYWQFCSKREDGGSFFGGQARVIAFVRCALLVRALCRSMGAMVCLHIMFHVVVARLIGSHFGSCRVTRVAL